jgi:hypothetical protein
MNKDDSKKIQEQLDEARLRLKLEYQQIPFGILSLLIISAICPVFAKRRLSDTDVSSLTLKGYFIFVAIIFSFFLLLYLLNLVGDISKIKQRIKALKAELDDR